MIEINKVYELGNKMKDPSIQDEINTYLKINTQHFLDIALLKFIKFLTIKWNEAQGEKYEEDLIKQYLIHESYSLPYARTIFGNYTTLLRNENRQQPSRDYNNVV